MVPYSFREGALGLAEGAVAGVGFPRKLWKDRKVQGLASGCLAALVADMRAVGDAK